MYSEVMAEPNVATVLRLPPELHAALVTLAKEEQRSLNGQIVYMLRRGLADYQKEDK